MKDKRNSSFGYRGTFKCGSCDRSTRQVRGVGNDNCCPECYELAGLENAGLDGCLTDADYPYIRQLWADILAKGGCPLMMEQSFSHQIVKIVKCCS